MSSFGGSHGRDAATIEPAHLANRRWAHEALCDSRHQSFGIQAEFRISWPLFEAPMSRFRLEPREEVKVVHTVAPPSTWAIKTDVYLKFLLAHCGQVCQLV